MLRKCKFILPRLHDVVHVHAEVIQLILIKKGKAGGVACTINKSLCATNSWISGFCVRLTVIIPMVALLSGTLNTILAGPTFALIALTSLAHR